MNGNVTIISRITKKLPILSVLLILLGSSLSVETALYTLGAEKIEQGLVSNEGLTIGGQTSKLLMWGDAEVLGKRSYIFRTTIAADWFGIAPFTQEEAERLRVTVNELHSMGMKYMGYFGFLLSMKPTDELLEYYPEFSPENAGFIDLDGNPVINGYDSEGRPLFYPFIHRSVFQKMLFNMINYSIYAGLDAIVFDVPEGMIGNLRRGFDNETLAAFREFLASKYTMDELASLGVENVTTFDFAQYLRDLGYTASTLPASGPIETNASILWRDWAANDALMFRNFFSKLYTKAKEYAASKGKDFKIFMNHGILPSSTALFISQYYDGMWTEAYHEQENYPLTSLFPCHYKIYYGLGKMFATMTLPSPINSSSTVPDNWKIAVSDIYASGGKIAQTLDDSLDPYFMLVSSHPELFGGQPDSDVAVLFSVPTYKFDLYQLYGELMWNHYTVSSLNYERGNHLRGFESIFYLMRDSSLTFDTLLIGDEEWVNRTLYLEDLQKYRAVLIPDLRCISDQDADTLLQYASNGGTLLAIGLNIGAYDERGNEVNRHWFTELFNGSKIDYGNGTVASLLNATWIDYRETKSSSALDMFKAFMNEVVAPSLHTNLSEVFISKWWKPNSSSMIFHLVNHKYALTNDRVIPQKNATLSFIPRSELTGVDLEIKLYSPEFPSGLELDYAENQNGWINIVIPSLNVWAVLKVRQKSGLAPREDWVVSSPEVVEGETIVLNGDVIVNSSLKLINSELRVNGTSDRHFKIRVYAGGSLALINSTITAYNEKHSYYIKVEKDARFFMEDSQISFAGALGPFYSGGLWIETNDTMIINSKIHDNYVYGVYIRDAKNVVIVNTTIYNCGIGIYLDNISTAKILSCTGTKTGTAIIIWRSLYVLIRNCYVTNSQYFGIRVWKSNWVRIENSLLANNTIEGITVWNSPFTTVFNNTIGKGGYGIAVRETPIITISSNNVYNTSIGVYLERTAGPTSTTIYPFTKPPLEISIRPLNTIVNNRIFNNTYGGYFYDVGLAKFCKNDMRNNVYGMHFVKAIGIETCPNIFIFQNNFVENENHWTQKDSMLIFQFHNTTHGNFWDNYSGNDDEGDGIGDTPYQIDGVFDYYPLMEPVDVGSSVDNLYPNIVTAREVLENGTLLEITAQVTDTSELVWTMINWTLGNESRIDPIYVAIVYFPDLETGNNEFQMLPPETVEDYQNVTFTLLLNLNEDFPENVTREYRIYSADTFGNWGEWPIPPTIENSNPPASIINLTDVKFTAKVKGDVKKVIMILNERHYNMSLNEQFQLYEIILTLTEGFHNWYLTAEDYLGRTDIIPMRKMTVDVTPPKIINVSQIPPQDKVQSEDEVKVNATVTDAITKVKQVLLNYTFTNSSGTWFNLIDMTNLKDNVWNATIPAFPYGTNVTYRIIATDTANNTVVSDNLGYVYSYEVIPEIPSMLIFLLFIVTTTIVTVTYKVKQCKSTQ